MQIEPVATFVCPIDGLALSADDRALGCPAGHGYDRAREGYVNLLTVQHKASRDPGDSREMVAARRRVLDRGNYAPLADRVAEIACATVVAAGGAAPFRIVDAGCGEGYYLDRLAQTLLSTPGEQRVELAGIDISKWAVRAAAKRGTAAAFAVASNRRPPFPPASIDLILSLFGFPIWEGFRAVQAPGHHVLLVDPGPEHLIELREVIYPTVQRSGPPSLEAAATVGYALAHEWQSTYATDLESHAAIQDLLAMTPHAHRMAAPGRAAAEQLQRLTVTVDVRLRLLRLGG